MCRNVVRSALSVVILLIGATAVPAGAAIVKVQDAQSCQVTGLDESLESIQGGVHCDLGDAGFSLAGILDGTIALLIGNSQTPSWNIVNDTGAEVLTLTLYYSGALAPNAFIDMQVGGDWFSACTSDDGIALASDDGCGSGDKTTKPEDGGQLPVALTWSGGTGIGIGETFNLGTASFAHSGEDAGCLSGNANCTPAVVPVPAAAWLFGSALFGLMVTSRRRTA